MRLHSSCLPEKAISRLKTHTHTHTQKLSPHRTFVRSLGAGIPPFAPTALQLERRCQHHGFWVEGDVEIARMEVRQHFADREMRGTRLTLRRLGKTRRIDRAEGRRRLQP